jgi:tetratricopeptide (TPR) repeat protein
VNGSAERRILEQRRAYAQRDLQELARQVDEGEIGEAAAARLEEGYRAEIDEVEAALAESSRPPKGVSDAEAPPAPAGRRGVRIGMFTAAVLLVLTVIVAVMGRDDGPAPMAATETPPPTPATGSGDEELDRLMQAVAQNPEVNAMRLALGDVLFGRRNYADAGEQYDFVLGNDPTGDEAHTALVGMGSVAFHLGDLQLAVDILGPMAEANPTNAQTLFYLGAALLERGEAAAAIPHFDALLAMPGLAPGARSEVEAMLAAARSVEGG